MFSKNAAAGLSSFLCCYDVRFFLKKSVLQIYLKKSSEIVRGRDMDLDINEGFLDKKLKPQENNSKFNSKTEYAKFEKRTPKIDPNRGVNK